MSMTGFGKKEAQFKDKNINVEVRSLNSKNADINLKTPSYLRELDPEIRKMFINKMHRGKIDINVFIEFNGEISPAKINKSIVKAYMDQLKDIAHVSDSESLSLAMNLPEALSSEKGSANSKEKKAILTLFDEVIEEYVERRNILIQELQKIPGVKVAKPKGAFYCIVELPITNADAFAQWLLEAFRVENETIMMAPAAGFYATPGLGKNQLRIAYVLKKEDLIKSVNILKQGLKVYKNLE